MYGFTDSDLTFLSNLFKKYPNIDKAILFGSGAKGTYHTGSDVDIALKGNDLKGAILQLSTYLNQESPLPYGFDIVDYDSLDNQDLIAHIDRVGKVIYTRNR